jgi:hypothetical protein
VVKRASKNQLDAWRVRLDARTARSFMVGIPHELLSTLNTHSKHAGAVDMPICGGRERSRLYLLRGQVGGVRTATKPERQRPERTVTRQTTH